MNLHAILSLSLTSTLSVVFIWQMKHNAVNVYNTPQIFAKIIGITTYSYWTANDLVLRNNTAVDCIQFNICLVKYTNTHYTVLHTIIMNASKIYTHILTLCTHYMRKKKQWIAFTDSMYRLCVMVEIARRHTRTHPRCAWYGYDYSHYSRFVLFIAIIYIF